MEQNFEIEFKNMLTEVEYSTLLRNEFQESMETPNLQSNYYFDTLSKTLKEQGSILRVRVRESFNELTFKVPHQGFLMETNYHLSHNEVSEIIQAKQMKLSAYLSSTDSLPELENISKETRFYLFNQFETKRLEKQVDEHLIVLDQTRFQNGVIDYELEVESKDSSQGRMFFEEFLEKYKIPERSTLPKIARAERNR